MGLLFDPRTVWLTLLLMLGPPLSPTTATLPENQSYASKCVSTLDFEALILLDTQDIGNYFKHARDTAPAVDGLLNETWRASGLFGLE